MTAQNKTKSLFIGLDGAEPALLQHWSEQGLLPNINKLLCSHYNKPIRSPKGFGDGGLWSSLVTGVNPGKHGHYFPSQFNAQNYMLDHYAIDTDLQRGPFWHFCSKMGRKVAVIDIYTSPLRAGLNGIQVMDWMIHDRMSSPRSWPTSLIDTLHEKYMVDPLGGNSECEHRTDADFLKLHQDVLNRIEAKTNACVDLIENNDWDLFCVGYCDAHDIGHQSWHWHDIGSESHPAELVKQHGDPLLLCYQALDTAVGRLLESAQTENVFIVAGLGMGKQSLCNSGLQQILAHYCGVTGDRDSAIRQRQHMPYFELPHNMHSGAVRVNLQGRESNGVVAKHDYDKVLAELAEKFTRLTDADSGETLVKEVVFVHENYPGRFQNNLPDMFVIWNKPLTVKTIQVDEFKQVALEPVYKFEYRSGDHTDAALFISSIDYAEDAVEAESIAATICSTLGVNLPETDAPPLTLVAPEFLN